MDPPIPYPTLQTWKSQCHSLDSSLFLLTLPKIELHVHLEGTLTPSLRFALARRNNIPLHSSRLNKDFHTLDELQEAYNLLQPRSVKGRGVSAFFEAYYGGMEVLRTEEDFYELAMAYFDKAKAMNVRYAEVMFDLQAHTRRGVGVETVMVALRRAREDAEKHLDVKSNFIACFLRDQSLESALTHYELLVPYHDIIVGVGLDGNEFERPPMLFDELFKRARRDGLRITAHCDVKQPNTLTNIRQVVEEIGGTGADRVDHGLDAAADASLVQAIKAKGTGMTLCPWAYVRHHTEQDLFGFLRVLKDEQVKICISCDSPAYVEDNWVLQNLSLLRLRGGLTDEELLGAQRDAIEMCWASEGVKTCLREDIHRFCEISSTL
ncbi:adenosine deaminase [Mollisia scopiformis]|uniref:Adenosine deaminase n=1 Tax=Mollisia scopiformis TaxID=149040 RepID=A0A194X562_MOLSC|nr:adenosine deaminase [Mollisia scopiformis]KUJ15318.1 adenosine deaminase [Mollisia scopiformis]